MEQVVELIEIEKLDELKKFIGFISRKNCYAVIAKLYRHPEGITGGEILGKTSVSQSETSSTLRVLAKHGFAIAERRGKYIDYYPNFDKFEFLLEFYDLIFSTETT